METRAVRTIHIGRGRDLKLFYLVMFIINFAIITFLQIAFLQKDNRPLKQNLMRTAGYSVLLSSVSIIIVFLGITFI